MREINAISCTERYREAEQAKWEQHEVDAKFCGRTMKHFVHKRRSCRSRNHEGAGRKAGLKDKRAKADVSKEGDITSDDLARVATFVVGWM